MKHQEWLRNLSAVQNNEFKLVSEGIQQWSSELCAQELMESLIGCIKSLIWVSLSHSAWENNNTSFPFFFFNEEFPFNIDWETGFLFLHLWKFILKFKNKKEGVTCVHMYHLNQFNKALTIFLDQNVFCLEKQFEIYSQAGSLHLLQSVQSGIHISWGFILSNLSLSGG